MKIIDTTSFLNMGLQLFKHDWLQTITKKSGKLAEDNEYQVHYWAMVFRETCGDSYIDISIPLVFFNYPMEVSVTSIDAQGEDIQKISEDTKELAELKAKELYQKLKNNNSPLVKEGIKIYVTPLMTIHRHP